MKDTVRGKKGRAFSARRKGSKEKEEGGPRGLIAHIHGYSSHTPMPCPTQDTDALQAQAQAQEKADAKSFKMVSFAWVAFAAGANS